MKKVACEQALRGNLAVGREKEGELATTFLEFEYLHQKSQCEMLIGRDDFSNDMFFNVCLHSCSFPLRAYWQKSDSSVDGEPQGNWGWNSNSRDVVAKLSFLYPPHHQSLLAGYEKGASARGVKHRKQKIQFGFVTFVFAVTELRNIITMQQHCFLVKLIARP